MLIGVCDDTLLADQIRTPPGEEVPALGKPFKESKESKNSRKNADTSGGFGNYELV